MKETWTVIMYYLCGSFMSVNKRIITNKFDYKHTTILCGYCNRYYLHFAKELYSPNI